MKPTTLFAALAVPLLACSLSAQTPDHLVGLTRLDNLRHVDHWACGPIAQCPVPIPAIAVMPAWAGGTGWDPVRSGAWVTDGRMLAKVDDNCTVQCAPIPFPGLGPNAFATGLEVVESLNQLWMIDSLGNLHMLTNTCPPNPVAVCNTGLGPIAVQTVTSGLAVDEGNGIVFISHCDFATGANFIAISRLAAPCTILCRIPAPACLVAPFGTITGLAVNWGRRTLYMTDGANTIASQYLVAATGCVAWGVTNCCFMPIVGVDPMVGLAVRPGRATSMGNPCANGVCPLCPMVHTLGNDPNLGNAFFRLDLDQAPSGSLAWCIFGTGPCNAPGVSAPPLCGPVFSVPVLGTLGPNPTGGVGPCAGSTNFSFPLPPWSGLAGWTISSQCVALCVAGGSIGTAVSNCLSYTLQGN